MKKNLYYRSIYKRQNVLKIAILGFFFNLSSYPRLLLEVFTRKNFGERYFTAASALTVAAIFSFIPWFNEYVLLFIENSFGTPPNFWAKYASWYMFIAAFLYFSFLRWKEIQRNPSVFDFKSFSQYAGDIDQRLYSLPIFKKRPDTRTVEILVEPGLFFILGLVLWLLFGQSVGILLVVCSIMYSLSYAGAYMQGDYFVMDKLDEMYVNEKLEDSFVYDADTNENQFRFRGRKPSSEDLRRKVSDSFIEEIHEVEQVTEAF